MIDRHMREKIEDAFYNYDSMKKQGAEYLVELAEQGVTANYGGVGGKSGVSNPTEAKGIKAAEQRAIAWCKMVEYAIDRADNGKRELIELKYKKRKSAVQICMQLYITEATLYNWLTDILTDAAFYAIQEGLIRVI